MHERVDWVRLRSNRGGRCCNCRVRFGAGSDIEWHPLGNRVRCGPCADGKDPAWRRLKPEQRAFIEEQMFEAGRLSNLISPAKERQAERLNELLDSLRKFKHLEVVERFFGRFEITH